MEQGTLAWYTRQLASLENEATPAIESASTAAELESVRVKFLGRQAGWMTTLSKELGALSASDKPDAGKAFNELKHLLTERIEQKIEALSRGQQPESALDLTLPARRTWRGARHPVTIVLEEIEQIFREIGFTVALGPEAESEWYNFGALNFPPNHPAMDMHDTLYVEGASDIVLRTHTSPVQVRTLQRYEPPIRIIAPGNVYRRDFFDALHAPMFAQLEGLAVDEGIGFVDLKATLTHFANRFFGERPTRFRPSYFPFTEPSAEMDVQCGICGGSGCAACKGTGWIEIMGCGMVHPAVLESAGLDSERYSGWAFGMGPARIAISRYGIPDIRILYDSDVRFLEQFAE